MLALINEFDELHEFGGRSDVVANTVNSMIEWWTQIENNVTYTMQHSAIPINHATSIEHRISGPIFPLLKLTVLSKYCIYVQGQTIVQRVIGEYEWEYRQIYDSSSNVIDSIENYLSYTFYPMIIESHCVDADGKLIY